MGKNGRRLDEDNPLLQRDNAENVIFGTYADIQQSSCQVPGNFLDGLKIVFLYFCTLVTMPCVWLCVFCFLLSGEALCVLFSVVW